MAEEVDNVRVIVRCRPLSEVELENGFKSVVNIDHDSHSVCVSNPNAPQVYFLCYSIRNELIT